MNRRCLLFAGAALLLASCSPVFSPELQKARRQFSRQNYIEVVDTLNAALPLWKNSDGNLQRAEAYELLGESYHKLLDTDKAEEAYEQALAASTSSFKAAYELGMIHLGRNEADLAEKYFRQASSIKRNDPMALLGLGNAMYAQKKNEEAKVYFEAVLDVSPGVRNALDCLAALKQPSPLKKSSAPNGAYRGAVQFNVHRRRR